MRTLRRLRILLGKSADTTEMTPCIDETRQVLPCGLRYHCQTLPTA